MRAIQVAEFGGPERLTLVDAAKPAPGPGEVLVAPEIDREFPLAEAAEAHRTIEGRQTRGKLLLRIG